MTDRAIVRAGLARHRRRRRPPRPSTSSSSPTSSRSPRSSPPPRAAVVHAGIEAALDAAARAPAPPSASGTGNLHDGARLKLVAGRASTSASRSAASAAITRTAPRCSASAPSAARRRSARPLDACRVVVIGDTPKDVAAAQAIGAECIAVATGSFGVEALAACGPPVGVREPRGGGRRPAVIEGA